MYVKGALHTKFNYRISNNVSGYELVKYHLNKVLKLLFVKYKRAVTLHIFNKFHPDPY